MYFLLILFKSSVKEGEHEKINLKKNQFLQAALYSVVKQQKRGDSLWIYEPFLLKKESIFFFVPKTLQCLIIKMEHQNHSN